MSQPVAIDVVIPAFNEAAGIQETVQSVLEYAGHLVRDIVVVDNGSTDATAALARKAGASVVPSTGRTISAVRNTGAAVGSAPVIVFLDADVSLTAEWRDEIGNVISSVLADQNQILGSRCETDGKDRFLNRFWFTRLARANNGSADRYVNSGHLITSRVLYERLEGFDEERQTAEDYDFCIRACRSGASIANLPSLRVIHRDYPTSVAAFFRREWWHGLDDFKDRSSIRQSRMAWVVLFNVTYFTFSLILSVALASVMPMLFYVLCMYALMVVLTRLKFGSDAPEKLLLSAAIYCVYLGGRSMSLFSQLRQHIVH